MPSADAAGSAEGGQHIARPAPAGGTHAGGEARGVLVGRRVFAGAEAGEQGFGHWAQVQNSVFLGGGDVHVERAGEAGGRRRQGLRGADEGKKLEQV